MRRARGISAKVGLYLLYRFRDALETQWDLFRSVADAVKLGSGDLVPALNIEHDPLPRPGADVAPSWSGPLEELAGRISETFGNTVLYTTQREWGLLGKPTWLLRHPLWVAHYTSAPRPASPNGVEPTIWQYRVGPFDPLAAGGFDHARPELDHNRALGPLPVIGKVVNGSLPDEHLDDLRDAAALALFGAGAPLAS